MSGIHSVRVIFFANVALSIDITVARNVNAVLDICKRWDREGGGAAGNNRQDVMGDPHLTMHLLWSGMKVGAEGRSFSRSVTRWLH